MNVKYSLSQYVIAMLAAATALVMPTACNDDLGYQNVEGQQIGFKLSAPDTWHEGMPINENAPTTHCTSVRALSGGDTKLYLHTVVADNPAEEKVAVTRGTPVKGTAAFQDRYKRFSLSGICYTGEYPDEEAGAQNDWTTEYAYNLYYDTTTGKAEKESDKLFWPTNGQVRFFAFAPTVEDFNKLETGGTLTLSEATDKGSPTLTYTVPTDVTKQVDLMTVCNTVKATTTPEVELNFGHALTAVQIKCGKDMLAGKITEVTISGIYGKGRQVIGADTWTTLDDTKATYTISKEITLSTGEDATDKVHVPENTPIAGTDTDNLTFMLLPQTLPDGATMTIKFTDAVTNTERTLSGSIAGQEWKAGKIVTYSVSPSSIHINAKVEFSKKGITADNPTGDVIPYSGVWYDATYTAKTEVTQEGVDTKTIDIPADKVKFQYRLKDSDPWTDCTTDADGLLTIAAQPAYTTMSSGFDKASENGSEETPYSLPSEYDGETANCYLVDKAGYYSLPLVYGNGYLTLPAENPDGFKYFPKHDDQEIPADGKISGVEDAVLCWQDAPDLIDSASVHIDKSNNTLVFRIRKQTLAQGNALLAVRGTDSSTGEKIILWSWHIWVTPYKTDFYDQTMFYHSVTDVAPEGYDFAQYNLGWCDHHDHNESRTFSLQAVIDMSAYGGTTETVDLGTFTQMEFKGSDAGDNTYYQWGRKDPMLGGIYNDNTPNYKYKKKGTSPDSNEFTMENKQVFNQYNQDGYNYSFCKNPGDAIDMNDYASNGVTIGYAIQHPYMFVTNSRCNDGGDEPIPAFNYRNHWHKPYTDLAVGYLDKDSHIMFNAWDAGATNAGASDGTNSNYYYNVFSNAGTIKDNVKDDYLKSNAANIKKSVYDPCPPKFKVPPIDAFRGIAKARPSNDNYYGLGSVSFSNNACTMTTDGKSITFPITGVRDYALRSNEWRTVEPTGAESEEGKKSFYETFYKTSMPAFKMLSFVSSATIVKKEEYNAYQLLIFVIDKKNRTNPYSAQNIKMSCFTTSSNSYGMPVRPIHYN